MITAFMLAVMIVYVILAVKKPGIALITSPFASAVSYLLAVCIDERLSSDDLMIISLGVLIFPVVLLIVAAVPLWKKNRTFWPHATARAILKIIWYSLLLLFLMTVLNIFGVGLWVFYMLFVCGYSMSRRKSIEMDIISTIGACMRQNLPLATSLDTAAASYPEKSAMIFKKISKWLTKGYSLSESLKRGYPRCPAYITSTVTAAESLGQLPEAIRSIEAEIAEKSDDSKKLQAIQPQYPFVVFAVVVFVSLSLMIFIVPTFAEVLDDMGDGATLPYVTQVLLNISHWLLGRKGLNAFLVILPVIIVAGFKSASSLHNRFRRNNSDSQWLFATVTDIIKWYLPFWHWFEMNYSLMRLAAILRVGLASGRPVDVAIGEACGLNLNNCFRKRIRRWLKCVQRGDDISASATKCGIGHSVAWAFDAEINAGNTPEILRMLESFYRENFSYKLNIARAILEPVMVVMLGVCVAFVALGMFLPIIKIITILTESVIP